MLSYTVEWFVKTNTMDPSEITLNHYNKTFVGMPGIFSLNINPVSWTQIIYLHLLKFSGSFSTYIFDWLPCVGNITIDLLFPSFHFLTLGWYQFKTFPLAQTQLWRDRCFLVNILSRSIPLLPCYLNSAIITFYFLDPRENRLIFYFARHQSFGWHDIHACNDTPDGWICGLLGIQFCNTYKKNTMFLCMLFMES